jgi:hypothetical protein
MMMMAIIVENVVRTLTLIQIDMSGAVLMLIIDIIMSYDTMIIEYVEIQ